MFKYISWTAHSNDSWPMPFKNHGYERWELQDRIRPYSGEGGSDVFFAILPRASLKEAWEDYGLPLRWSLGDENENATQMAADKKTLMDWLWQDSTMLHCRFMPTDITLNFTYSGVDQMQHISVLEMKDSNQPDYNETSLESSGPDFTFVSEVPGPTTVLVGAPVAPSVSSHSARPRTSVSMPTITARSTPPDRPLRLYTSPESNIDVANITELARHTLKLMSWAAVQQAATTLWSGASNSRMITPGMARITSLGNNTGILDFSTRIFATVMQDSRELRRLNRPAATANELTGASSGLAYDQAASLLANISTSESGRPFKDMIEDLFLNITLSMSSSKSLAYQESSPLAPMKTQVTQRRYGNTYSYASDKLWLAYGIAIGVCVLNLVIGLSSVVRAGTSFTNNFSTIVRVARNADIEVDTHEDDFPGRDPLPKPMADTKLNIRKEKSLLNIKHNGLTDVTDSRRSSYAT